MILPLQTYGLSHTAAAAKEETSEDEEDNVVEEFKILLSLAINAG